MLNSSAPSRFKMFTAVRAFLAANGIKSFRYGPPTFSQDGLLDCALPLACFWAEAANITTHEGVFEEEQKIVCDIYFQNDATGPYSATYDGMDQVWKLHDDVLSGSDSFEIWFPKYGTGQFQATIDRNGWEEAWGMPPGFPYRGVTLSIMCSLSIGPSTRPAINLQED